VRKRRGLRGKKLGLSDVGRVDRFAKRFTCKLQTRNCDFSLLLDSFSVPGMLRKTCNKPMFPYAYTHARAHARTHTYMHRERERERARGGGQQGQQQKHPPRVRVSIQINFPDEFAKTFAI
jgi:hypothetical protein